MDLSVIDNIKWDNLEQAYGSAKHAPERLRALASDDEDERDDAIYDFLHGEVCHQYTTYSCTPFVIRCVLHIIQNMVIDPSSLKEILSFIHACTYNAKTLDVLRNEILAGSDYYEELLSNNDLAIKNEAKRLLEFCAGYE